MDKSFSSLLSEINSLLILLPTDPHFDQVAAGLSLFLSLEHKKDVSITCPSPMLVEFNHLVGVDKVVSEVGNKNLVIKFTDYEATQIERVTYDIEGGEFKLTVIPRSGITAPKKEQVKHLYSGVNAEAVCLIGGAHEDHFPHLKEEGLAESKCLHLGVNDISISRLKRNVISFARPATAISEIVAGLIKNEGFDINHDIASNLLSGIEEGSKNFTHPAVTSETFEIVAYLMKQGGKRHARSFPEKAMFPSGSIPQAKVEEKEIEEEFIEKKEVVTEVPKTWFGPKIYKGTSIS